MNIFAGVKAKIHIVTSNFTSCQPTNTAIETALFFSVITTGQGYRPDPWPFRFSQASQPGQAGGGMWSEGARILSAAFFPTVFFYGRHKSKRWCTYGLWGGGASVQLPATFLLSPGGHATCFNVLERAGGRHSLSTRFYIHHTVALLEQQSLTQLAFLLAYVYLSFSAKKQREQPAVLSRCSDDFDTNLQWRVTSLSR